MFIVFFKVLFGVYIFRICWGLNLVLSLEEISIEWWEEEFERDWLFIESGNKLLLLIMEGG